MSEQSQDWDDAPYWSTTLAVGRSRRYHTMMQRFYEGAHELVIAGNATLGAGAFVALLGGRSTELAQWLTGIMALGSALDTAFAFSRKAKRHADLARRFTELAARMIEKSATPASLRWASAERVKIERDEPPVRRLIDIQAQNEELRSRGIDPIYQTPLRWHQRFLGYVFTYGMGRLERLEDERQRRRLADAEAEVTRIEAQAENSAKTS